MTLSNPDEPHTPIHILCDNVRQSYAACKAAEHQADETHSQAQAARSELFDRQKDLEVAQNALLWALQTAPAPSARTTLPNPNVSLRTGRPVEPR